MYSSKRFATVHAETGERPCVFRRAVTHTHAGHLLY